eukprot:gene11012-12175_t
MIIYKDAITGDELFSDSYKIEVVDDILYHVYGKFVKESSDDSNINIGANPSAEEEQEGFEANVTTGIDVCLANRLVDSSMTKSDYKKHVKAFSKALLANAKPERAEFLKANLPKAVAKFLESFDDYSLFVGESVQEGGTVVLCKYADNCIIGSTVDVWVWKDSVVEEKQ